MIIWIIGLSGSGKTTLANDVIEQARAEKSNIVFRGTVIAVSTQIIGIIVLGSLFEINGIALSAVIGSFAVSIFYIITVRLNKF